MLKRWIAAALSVLCLLPVYDAGAVGSPTLSAACAILVDGESGRVLFEQNAHEERAIASITKLMTAYVAVQHTDSLAQEVVIRPEWTGIEGSSVYLKAGERVTLETLLYGLLLNSGNDAAVAIACHCAGDQETFVAWMNECAAQLGMTQTHFLNPNGLNEEGHYSTAFDMALLARACKQDAIVSKIVATKSITLGTRTFSNHNKLLWRYEGCTGMKTGYTEASGRTLVSSAQREGRTLIAVTLNAPDDWTDHTKLFDYGFDNFTRHLLCRKNKTVAQVPVFGGLVPFVGVVTEQDLHYPLALRENVSAKYDLCDGVDAPVQCGTVLGTLSFYLDDELIGKTDLIAKRSVHCDCAPPRTFLEKLF